MNTGNIAVIVAAAIFFIVLISLFVGPVRRFFKSIMGLEEEAGYLISRTDPYMYKLSKRELIELYRAEAARLGVKPSELTRQLMQIEDGTLPQTKAAIRSKFRRAADLANETKNLERVKAYAQRYKELERLERIKKAKEIEEYKQKRADIKRLEQMQRQYAGSSTSGML